MGALLGKNFTRNIGAFWGKKLMLNMGGGGFLRENWTHNMEAFLGKNRMQNVGAIFSSNLSLNMGGLFSCKFNV